MPVLGRTGSVPLKQWVVRFASKSRAGEVVHIREAEYPVRRGLSVLSLMSRNTGSPAFAGDDTSWRRQIGRLKIEPVPQILALLQNSFQERAVGVAFHHRLDQIELVHGDKLQDLGARFAGGVAWQGLHHLDMFRRPWTFHPRLLLPPFPPHPRLAPFSQS